MGEPVSMYFAIQGQEKLEMSRLRKLVVSQDEHPVAVPDVQERHE